MSTYGIVVAAGRGRRFGGSKHDALLGGTPLWRHAADALLEGGVDQVITVGPVPGGIPGGERRRDSVLAGLEAVPAEVEHVLVHDAARPLASASLVVRVLERLRSGDAVAVVPVLPVPDALKRLDGDWVEATVDRSTLAVAQTPQGFVASMLREAHAAYPDDVPDDAALVERLGGKVAAVPGEPSNIKVTYPADLVLAGALLQ
ncbi:MAG: 2-C-methyl-D-erythritol 4-phosphate cytidylyltransferase [Acidimicrobiia bacterium]